MITKRQKRRSPKRIARKRRDVDGTLNAGQDLAAALPGLFDLA